MEQTENTLRAGDGASNAPHREGQAGYGLPADELASIALVDASLSGLLSRCLLRPTLELAAEIRSGGLHRSLTDLIDDAADDGIGQAIGWIVSFQEQLATMSVEKSRLILEVDYNRLFVGPGRLLAPPYESFYKTGRSEDGRGHLRGQPEREVHAEYRSHGYRMPESFVDYPDHIAVELEFIAVMTEEEANAWRRGDADRALSIQQYVDSFRSRHPASWFPEFKGDVHSGARHVFYPAVTNLIETLVLPACE